MNLRPKLHFVALSMLATSSIGYGQLVVKLWTDATYRQKSLTQSDFRGVGEFGVLLRDGVESLNPSCYYNANGGSLLPFLPNVLLGCPLGSNAYFSARDISPGSQGIADTLLYWETSFAKPPVVTIAPFYPQSTSLFAAPPSKLPRPMGSFADESSVVFYSVDLMYKEYMLAKYRYGQKYDTVNYKDGPAAGYDFKSQIVPGEYIFHFPYAADPTMEAQITAVYQPMPEGWSNQGLISSGPYYFGFRFTKLNGAPLVWDSLGFVEIDPRMMNTISWEGNSPSLVFPTLDVLRFHIVNLGGTPGTPGNANLDPVDPTAVLFPNFTGSTLTYVTLPSPIDTSYVLPPNVIQPIAVAPSFQTTNAEAILKLDLVRAIPSSTIAMDVSERYFQLPVRFVNTYAGWASVAFAGMPGLTAAAKLPSADPDHDGFTNLQEWLMGTDPASAASHPAPPIIAFVQGRATRSTNSASTGYWETSMAKAVVSSNVTYEYEFSSDMQTWRTIGADDADWNVINTDGQIKLQSKSPQLKGPGFLRVKMSDNTPVSTQ